LSLGRTEFRIFLVVYLITLPIQIITNGSLLPQGSTAIVVFTALHAGLIVALFWILLANALVATQWIDDGTMSSIMVREYIFPKCSHLTELPLSVQPLMIGAIILFGGTVYISLDIAFGVTGTIGGLSSPPERIRSIPLFVLTSMWPIM
jgi:hypothetical protein